jgi:ATP/maltotriose-dependent transcriptional regulator MalT
MLDELLMEQPDGPVLVAILIQQSVAWRALGSPVAAMAFLDAAAKHVRANEPKQQGWIEHQRAHVLIEQRDFAAAAKSLALAVQFHRRAKSPYDEALALLAMARLAFEQGDPQSALVAARRAAAFAVKHKFNRSRLAALVDQARALSASGSPDEGRKLLLGVLADSKVAEDNRVCFYAHFYLWQNERDSGNIGRAAVELREAGYYLKHVDQNNPEAIAVRRELGGFERHQRSQAANATAVSSRRRSGSA